MIKRWIQLIVVVVALYNAHARPKEDEFPIYRSLESKNDGSFGSAVTTDGSTTSRPNKTEKTLEDIAVVARSSYENPASQAAVAEVAKKVAVAVGQMAEDMRTPSNHIKEVPQLKKNESVASVVTSTTTTAVVSTTSAAVEKVEANGRFGVLSPKPAASKLAAQNNPQSFEGKAASSNKKEDIVRGVAVPVIMDEDTETPPKKLQKLPNVTKPVKDEKKKVATAIRPTKEPATTTSSSGLSTWILLSDNREATTPTSTKKKVTSTTKKPAKIQATPSPLKVTSKPGKKTAGSEKKSEPQPQSALESLVKQKTATLVTAQKKKVDSEKEKQSEHKKVVTIPPAIMIERPTSSAEPETTDVTPESTTKKKKTSSKKRKKNKNRKKNPAEKSGSDQILTDLVKKPKQPVGAQFYNFLSREIMPTVGLGLVGVLVTAGLAGLLGYNPFYGANIPVRRTYESQHGYYPNGNYYTYQSEFGDSDTSKNEEVLFREVLSGMPDDSRYAMPPAEVSYPETQLYNSQEQAYNSAKNTAVKKPESPDASFSAPYDTQYDSYTNQDQIGSKHPVYSGGAYVYPEKSTEKFKASAKYNEEDKIEKQPEALYRVSSDYTSGTGADDTSASGTDSDQAWHRIGSPMDQSSHLSYVEPGPRRLDLDKMTEKLTESQTHTRTRRSPEGILARLVRRSNEVAKLNFEDDKENEIDSDDGAGAADFTVTEKPNDSTPGEVSATDSPPVTTTSAFSLSTTEESPPSLSESFPSEAPPASTEAPPSLMDVLRRLAQFKLRLGINFLKATTDAFGKYLEGVQQRVEDSMANDTTFPAMRYTWLGRDAPTEGESKVREKRYQRNAKESTFENVDEDLTMES